MDRDVKNRIRAQIALTAKVKEQDLRDYFAGQALAAMVLCSDYSIGPCNAAIADRAYAMADAMLKARERKLETEAKQ